MEYKRPVPEAQEVKFKPRLIIHGGAGNIPSRDKMSPEMYAAYRKSLLTIVSKTDTYMRTALPTPPSEKLHHTSTSSERAGTKYPSALAIATYAVTQLEDDPLFNSGRGAVFTRDGVNELEASVMVSRPASHAKRGVGVTGLRRVRNPIQLARAILERGDEDLAGVGATKKKQRCEEADGNDDDGDRDAVEGSSGGGKNLDVPSAQGHTLIHGPTAESLARRYGLPLVEPSYFYTRRRWDEHARGLARERRGGAAAATASWSPDEYLPQGTCGAVALDGDGVLCVATSTGGMTNKLTGRIGDTPVVGAGFWAEEWEEEGGDVMEARQQNRDQDQDQEKDKGLRSYLNGLPGPVVELSSALRAFLADCLPAPSSLYDYYTPLATVYPHHPHRRHQKNKNKNPGTIRKTRATAISGTGNGDSFMRVAAARTVGAIARWSGASAAEALFRVAGPGGELQRSAGDRWGRTGEGEGGMIGIETTVTVVEEERVLSSGGVVGSAVIMHDHNSSGMYRAWIDDEGVARFKIWRDIDDE